MYPAKKRRIPTRVALLALDIMEPMNKAKFVIPRKDTCQRINSKVVLAFGYNSFEPIVVIIPQRKKNP